ALFARDHGCTRPNCTAPASCSQAHHITNWRDDGLTNIDTMTLACGRDNRLADTGGWTTTMGPHGRTHWTPPPLLDVGQPRTNHYHRPTLYPAEGDANDGESDSPAE
ncbi:HNH endonuclease signature motif containing protein, partial [Mycobacterium sp. SMC-18]